MAEDVQKAFAAMREIQGRLLAGEMFAELPQAVGHVADAVTVQPATLLVAPDDDEEAVARIAALRKAIKQSATPRIDNEDLDYLVSHLASPNPLVRDKGVFFLLSDLLQAHALSPKQVRNLVKTLMAPERLYAHIDETQNDGIFLRSFCVMILSGLVYADLNAYHVLTPEDYQELVLAAATYVILERDGRGFVDPHGWAHAFTHIGNLLDELTRVPSLTRGHKVFLMATTIASWQRVETPLVFGEDQRVAFYLTNLAAKHQFYAQSLVMCLTQWQRRLARLQPEESERFWSQWYNRMRLLEALLIRADLPQPVADYIQKILDM